MDIDSDGDMDLVTANSNAGSASVLLNQGDGTFPTRIQFAVGVGPQAVMSVDIDGDGLVDLAAANAASNSVSILRHCERPVGTAYCFGDGSLATPCPCAPPDTVPVPPAAFGHGCANSLNLGGALLHTSGALSPPPGTLAFDVYVAGPYVGFAFLVKGNANIAAGLAASDGIRCVNGQLIRFGGHNAGTNGAPTGRWTFPNSVQTTPVAIVTAQPPGEVAYYQLYYRSAAAGFCNPSTANWSNASQVTWPP